MEKLNENIAQKVMEWLIEKRSFSSLQRDKVFFAIRLILNDFEKTFLLAAIFTIFGYLIPFVICSVIVIVLRKYVGGIHLNSFGTCFFFSLFYFAIVIYLGRYAVIHQRWAWVIYGLDFLLTILFSPLASRERFFYGRKQKILIKIHSTILLLCIIFLSMSFVILQNYILWIMIAQIIEITSKVTFLRHMEGAHGL